MTAIFDKFDMKTNGRSLWVYLDVFDGTQYKFFNKSEEEKQKKSYFNIIPNVFQNRTPQKPY